MSRTEFEFKAVSFAHRLAELVRNRKPFTLILDGMPIRILVPSEMFVPDDLYKHLEYRNEDVWMDEGKLFAFKHSYGVWAVSGEVQADGKPAECVRVDFELDHVSGMIFEANDLYRDKQ